MNELQFNYAKLKAQYETTIEMEMWDLVEEIEDAMLDAEFALMDWVFEKCIEQGKLSKADCDMMRKNSNSEQWDKMVDLGMRLKL